MKFFNCGSNGDFRYARLPSFNSCEEGKDGECVDTIPRFVKWGDKYVPLTMNDRTTLEDEDGHPLDIGAYYLVVNLRGCSPLQRSSRNRYAGRFMKRIMNAKRETMHPQFLGNEHLYEEAKECTEQWRFFEKHDLLPFMSAVVSSISVPYITIAGGIAPEAESILAEMEDYELDEYTMPQDLPWPAGCWINGDHAPTGKKEYVALTQLQELMEGKTVSAREVKAMIAFLETLS